MDLILDCLYLVAGVCLLPFWLWRLPRAERYRAGIVQRLGFAPKMPEGKKRLWVHCASVGEASIPRELVARLERTHPDWDVVFSTNTNTGAGRLGELYPGCPTFYMPLDFSPCVGLALRRVRPSAVVLVELELWPNFARACYSHHVPLAIINGRIGRSSRRLLQVLSRLNGRLWDPLRACCARSADDAAGFLYAGVPADRVFNCGMLKCDGLTVESDPDREGRLRKLFAISAEAPVLVAGSTHQGEEAILAGAFRELRRRHRRLRMIIAPRHIERAREVAAAVQGRGFPVVTKTDLEAGRASASGDEVIIIDTIGDLVACYALATCAFVGRSLLAPGGGQNVLEPAALGKPVLTGPHTVNFAPEMNMLRTAGAAVVVRSGRQLVRETDRLLSSPDAVARMAEAARAIIRDSRGAAMRTMEKLEPMLQEAQ
jgi:3-deoxy-D-manno-octulosonic-acid transferase